MNIRIIFYGMAICLLSLLMTTEEVRADCDIVDVELLYGEKPELGYIRSSCTFIDDAPGCSVTKVYRLVHQNKSEDEIKRECAQRPQQSGNSPQPDQSQYPQQRPMYPNIPDGGPYIARFCNTPAGPCPMAVAIPPNSTCFCPTAYGPVYGISQ